MLFFFLSFALSYTSFSFLFIFLFFPFFSFLYFSFTNDKFSSPPPTPLHFFPIFSPSLLLSSSLVTLLYLSLPFLFFPSILPISNYLTIFLLLSSHLIRFQYSSLYPQPFLYLPSPFLPSPYHPLPIPTSYLPPISPSPPPIPYLPNPISLTGLSYPSSLPRYSGNREFTCPAP